MPIDVSCPQCGASLPVPDEFAGRTVQCGNCAGAVLVPPSLPTSVAAVPPPLSAPQSSVPVAKPIARAVPVKAEPRKPDPIPTDEPSEKSNSAPPAPEHERAKPAVKTAFFVIAGLLIFGCCGIGVVGYAFVKLTNSVAKNIPTKAGTVPSTAMTIPPPITARTTRQTPPVTPPPPPITPPSSRANPAPKSEIRSPVGMPGLKAYVSFDNETIREDVSRTKLGYEGVIRLLDGPRKKTARPVANPRRDNDSSRFALDLSASVGVFTIKEDQPFSLAMWVRGGGRDGVAFALLQDSPELGPKLLVKSTTRTVGVEFYCDDTDSDKKFVRTKTVPLQGLSSPFHHVAIIRSTGNELSVYVDGEKLGEMPADSLPAKQSAGASFKQAGFAMKPDNGLYTIELDEFCFFDRALTEAELKSLAGVEKK